MDADGSNNSTNTNNNTSNSSNINNNNNIHTTTSTSTVNDNCIDLDLFEEDTSEDSTYYMSNGSHNTSTTTMSSNPFVSKFEELFEKRQAPGGSGTRNHIIDSELACCVLCCTSCVSRCDLSLPILFMLCLQYDEYFKDFSAASIDSKVFKGLPPEMQLELLDQLKQAAMWNSKHNKILYTDISITFHSLELFSSFPPPSPSFFFFFFLTTHTTLQVSRRNKYRNY